MSDNVMNTPQKTNNAPPAPMTPEMKRLWMVQIHARVNYHNHVIKKLHEKSQNATNEAMNTCNSMISDEKSLSQNRSLLVGNHEKQVQNLKMEAESVENAADNMKYASGSFAELENAIIKVCVDVDMMHERLDHLKTQEKKENEHGAKLLELQKWLEESETSKKKAKEEEEDRDRLLEMIAEVQGQSVI